MAWTAISGVRLSLFAAVSALLSCIPVSGAEADDVTIHISGIRSDLGHVRVAVCPKSMFLQADCPWHTVIAAHKGSVIATLHDLPPGQYAAQAFHDEDDNGRLERGLLGMPREGMGFSRDAPMRFGPPRFSDAAFFVIQKADTILTIKYY